MRKMDLFQPRVSLNLRGFLVIFLLVVMIPPGLCCNHAERLEAEHRKREVERQAAEEAYNEWMRKWNEADRDACRIRSLDVAAVRRIEEQTGWIITAYKYNRYKREMERGTHPQYPGVLITMSESDYPYVGLVVSGGNDSRAAEKIDGGWHPGHPAGYDSPPFWTDIPKSVPLRQLVALVAEHGTETQKRRLRQQVPGISWRGGGDHWRWVDGEVEVEFKYSDRVGWLGHNTPYLVDVPLKDVCDELKERLSELLKALPPRFPRAGILIENQPKKPHEYNHNGYHPFAKMDYSSDGAWMHKQKFPGDPRSSLLSDDWERNPYYQGHGGPKPTEYPPKKSCICPRCEPWDSSF